MAVGKRKAIQQSLFVTTENLNLGPHPFYAAVNKVLDASPHFDTFAEGLCAKFYVDDPAKGRPAGVGPRRLLPLPDDRILRRHRLWSVASRGDALDSLSLKAFLGIMRWTG